MNVGAPAHPCPECGTVTPGAQCPRCGLPLAGPAAAELRHIDAQLASMDRHRAALLSRRAMLMATLRAQRPRSAPAAPGVPGIPTAPTASTAPAAPAAPGPGRPGPLNWPGWTVPTPPKPDAYSPSVQNVLLVLGALLLTVAGLAFTLLGWGEMSIGGRAAVLATVTALAFGAHAALRKRLPATAETAAVIGLVLVLLDCYAARAAGLFGLGGTDPVTYAAQVTGVVGIAVALYGSWTASLLLPTAGLLLLQAAAPLVAVAAGGGAVRVTTALALAAAFDLAAAGALPRLIARQEAARAATTAAVAARIAAAVTGVTAGWGAAAAALGATSSAPAARACGPLLIVAAVGAVAAYRRELPYAARVFAGVAAGASATVAVAALPHAAASHQWGPVAIAVPAAVLAVAAGRLALRREPADRPLWYGSALAGAVIVDLAVLRVLPQTVRTLGEPLRRAWQHGGPGRLGLGDRWTADGSVPVVIALFAVVLYSGAVFLDRRAEAAGGRPADREALLCAAAVAGYVAVATAVPAAGLPYAVALAAAWAPALAAVLWIVRRPQARPVTALCVLGSSAVLASAWALPDDAAALTVWSATALLAAGLAAGVREPASRRLGQGAAGFAVLAFGAVAARACLAAELPLQETAFGVLAVAVLSVPVAAALRNVAVESAGYGLTVAGVVMTAAHPQQFSLALAVAGCAALGVALRADRRQVAAPTGVGLLIAASWVRFALAGVTAPEPYALPVAAIALVLGHVRRRRDAQVGSWAAYGPGLAAGLVPSLGAALVDAHWLRPLLLGLAALAVTLYGARRRLAAPLMLGGGVLVVDALHELGPTVVQTLGTMPRWAPIALVGLLLLYLGATYERRRNDARRLATALRHLS